jgi:hypothetical protein
MKNRMFFSQGNNNIYYKPKKERTKNGDQQKINSTKPSIQQCNSIYNIPPLIQIIQNCPKQNTRTPKHNLPLRR